LELNETIEISIDNEEQGQAIQSEESEDDKLKISDMDTLPMPKKDALASSAIAPAVASDASPAVLVPMEIQANKNDSSRKAAKVMEAEELTSHNLLIPDVAKINKIEQMENSEVALLEPNASLREE